MSLFFIQLANEFKKLFARKRTHIGFLIFLLVECAFLFMLSRPGPQGHFRHLIEQNGYGFEQYFSGLTIAVLILSWTVILLGVCPSGGHRRRARREEVIPTTRPISP